MLPQTICATVHQDAIRRVNSFFNATADDIVRELFQNARRAGATRIDVTMISASDAGGRHWIRITDDGCGIADPAALLAFGQSNWDGRSHENPAGMGIYSLASTKCKITSRTADMPAGWQVTLEPEHYRGEAAAAVRTTGPKTPVGTTVQFATSAGNARTISRAAAYLPIRVTWEGRPTDQRNFADTHGEAGMVHGSDITFAVREGFLHDNEPYKSSHQGMVHDRATTINFHGHVIENGLRIPSVPGIDTCWTAAIDVRKCPQLHLVLPARKEVVRNEFIDELRRRGEHAIFTVLDSRTDTLELPYQTWKRGCAVLGHALRRTPLRLVPWMPRTPENTRERYENDTDGPQTVAADTALLIPATLPSAQQVLLSRALSECDNETPELYESETRYQGFPDYDELYKVREATVMVTEADGRTHPATDESEPGADRKSPEHGSGPGVRQRHRRAEAPGATEHPGRLLQRGFGGIRRYHRAAGDPGSGTRRGHTDGTGDDRVLPGGRLRR